MDGPWLNVRMISCQQALKHDSNGKQELPETLERPQFNFGQYQYPEH